VQRLIWKRLESVSKVIANRDIQYPFIILQPGETVDQLPAKIERWMAGEKVEGICGEYEGGEVGIGLPFAFVDPPPRQEE